MRGAVDLLITSIFHKPFNLKIKSLEDILYKWAFAIGGWFEMQMCTELLSNVSTKAFEWQCKLFKNTLFLISLPAWGSTYKKRHLVL